MAPCGKSERTAAERTAATECESRLPLFIRGAVTPKGFIGVTERILVRIAVALWSANFRYRRTNFPLYYAIFFAFSKFILQNLKIFFENLLTK